MSAPEPPALAAHWLAIALGDLQAAEALLTFATLPSRAAAEFAQQAAEKALKGAIVFVGMSPPRTHDLAALARLVPSESRFHDLRIDLRRLSGAFEPARYPSYFEPQLQHDEAVQLVSDARLIVLGVLDDLSSRGLERPEPI
jgi:HEPN domain-containing protein